MRIDQVAIQLDLLIFVLCSFSSRSAMLKRDSTIGSVSVGLSVCPSHVGNASKLMNVGSCGFYRRVSQGL